MVKVLEFVCMIFNHYNSCVANLETRGFYSVYDLKHKEQQQQELLYSFIHFFFDLV